MNLVQNHLVTPTDTLFRQNANTPLLYIFLMNHSISWLFFAYLQSSLVGVCTCAWMRWI
jgi:hypothetical protein